MDEKHYDIIEDENKNPQNQYHDDIRAQVVFTGLTLALVFSVFGVILFANFGSNSEQKAYACIPPTATPVPTYSNTFGASVGTNCSGVSNTVIKQRHDDAVEYLNNNYLHDIDIHLTAPSTITSATYIANWDILSTTDKNFYVDTYGGDWSLKNTPVLYVDAVSSTNVIARCWFHGYVNGAGKRLIIFKKEYGRSMFDDPVPDQHAKIIWHEYGHAARLNHTGDGDNVMGISAGGLYNSFSSDIAETDRGSLYHLPVSDHRDQICQFQNWDGYP
jgi:hypothetical protein